MKWVRCFVIVLVFWCVDGLSEPMRWGVIVHGSNGWCAAFWEGDECIAYAPPVGWKPLFPSWDTEEKKSFIQYKDRRCVFARGKEKSCCEQLGLAFRSDVKSVARPTPHSKDLHICDQ